MAGNGFDQVLPLGEKNDAYAQYFTGQSHLAPLAPGSVPVSNVLPVGMEPGTVIRVPSGTKHWHGARADSWFSHLAFITPAVTDEVYGRLPKNGTHA
ncbi:hypothetical protein [Streptomyces sp. NRRL F-5650]|uniref:hypothetical protein n=1 Tax=Streptomyces sp. NRRL F-5650 TaxID=1463868 RepID=UPI0004CA2141|nr:hypothetical protein [Streptomyces sp. NRRL F-5650]